MDKEQLKAYLCAAIDSLTEEELKAFQLPTVEPDLFSLANEFTVLAGEVKKMNSISLKMSNEMQTTLASLNVNQKQVEQSGLNTEQFKELLDSLITLDEFAQRSQEHTTELPVREMVDFLNIYSEWKGKTMIICEKLSEMIPADSSSFSLKSFFGLDANSKVKAEYFEELLLQNLHLLDAFKPFDFRSLEKLTVAYQSWKVGYEMFSWQWNKFMKSIGFVQTGKLTEIFNPLYHEAVGITSNAQIAANQITETVVMGYLFKNELIRRAKVVVNKKELNNE